MPLQAALSGANLVPSMAFSTSVFFATISSTPCGSFLRKVSKSFTCFARGGR